MSNVSSIILIGTIMKISSIFLPLALLVAAPAMAQQQSEVVQSRITLCHTALFDFEGNIRENSAERLQTMLDSLSEYERSETAKVCLAYTQGTRAGVLLGLKLARPAS